MKVDFSAQARLAFSRRLGDSWRDLADYLDIPYADRDRFEPGDEARGIWRWLVVRDRVGGLPVALIGIGRDDLASLLADALPPPAVEPASGPEGKYRISISNSENVQIGDHNVQNN
jgi:hypothetical protein